MSGCSKVGIGADGKQLRSFWASCQLALERHLLSQRCRQGHAIYKKSSELQEQENVFVELRDMPVNTVHGRWQVLDQPGLHSMFHATWGVY